MLLTEERTCNSTKFSVELVSTDRTKAAERTLDHGRHGHADTAIERRDKQFSGPQSPPIFRLSRNACFS